MHGRARGLAVLALLLIVPLAACGDERPGEGDDAQAEAQPGRFPQVHWNVLPGLLDDRRQGVAPGQFRELQQPGAAQGDESSRPNVLLITTDDQTLEEMRWMPKTRALFEKTGLRFTDALSPNPLCCPARAR